MSTISVPTREQVSPTNQALFDGLKKGLGMVPNLYATLALSDTALDSYLQFQNAKSSLSGKAREVVNLVVSQVNRCDYCLAAHTVIGKMVGFTDEQVLEIRSGRASFDAKLDALAIFVKGMVDHRGHVNAEAVSAFLAAGWTQANLVDAIVVIGDKTVTNYLHGATRVAIDFPAAPLWPTDRTNGRTHAMSIPLALKPAPVLASRAPSIDASLWPGVAVGLLAASIGALYTVFARWGMAQGLAASDMTVLRFAVAGLVTLPVLLGAIYRDAAGFLARWRVWLAVSLLAGPLFGLLMFSALHWAPASHAAVFPFTAMSLMGSLMSVWFLGDKLTWRKVVGMAVVASGLCVLADLSLASFSWRSLLGDAMFIAAGSLWAGFGIVMRRERLDPLLATATISFFALMTYVPAYALLVGPARLMAASAAVLWTEVLVQGLIAGAGTLYTYSRMVALLGPARAAVFPALAPAIAALLAWPVLGHVPGMGEITGMVLAMTGIVITVTAGTGSASPSPSPSKNT